MVRQRAEVLHQQFKLLGPPEITSGTGLRGRATRFIKRVVRKLTAWYIEPRWSAQIEFDAATAWAATEAANAIGHMAAELDRVGESVQRIERLLDRVSTTEDQLGRDVKALERSVVDVGRLHVANAGVAARVEALRRQMVASGAVASSDPSGPSSAYSISPLDYTAFEDRFRGSPAELEELQRSYLPFFGDPSVLRQIVDIGCGRGEMLKLLEEAGFKALGIDTDLGMLELCRTKGLDVVEADALLWLQSVEPDSIDGIFSAQVIEHLPTGAIVGLVPAAFRALRPGAFMVLETIDPRSVFALCNWFYADLSHVRPVYPPTLAFLCESAGFASVEIVGRSPHNAMTLADDLPDDPQGTAARLLLETVFGTQDYALIARK